jgi:hypothetical protein
MNEATPFLIYRSEDGRTKLDVRLENQTVWLSQKQLTGLFGKAKSTISEHIKHIFEDGELEPEATVRLFRTVQIEGFLTLNDRNILTHAGTGSKRALNAPRLELTRRAYTALKTALEIVCFNATVRSHARRRTRLFGFTEQLQPPRQSP